jgi:hypothetical protein
MSAINIALFFFFFDMMGLFIVDGSSLLEGGVDLSDTWGKLTLLGICYHKVI